MNGYERGSEDKADSTTGRDFAAEITESTENGEIPGEGQQMRHPAEEDRK